MVSETVPDTFENNDERQREANASAREQLPEMTEAEKEYWNRKQENARQLESRV